MPNSRDKGARAERELASAFEAVLGIPAYRTAQRTGKGGTADVAVSAPLHIECKRRARIAALAYLRQAERDATAGNCPIVAMREDGDTEWVVMVRLRDARAFGDAIRNAGAWTL